MLTILCLFMMKRFPDTGELPLVTTVLPSRDSEIRGAIVRTAKTNIILKRLLNSFQMKIHIKIITKQIRKGNQS